MDYEKLHIRTMQDLAKLPWFEADEKGVRLRGDADVPPIIDLHTHLGFSHGFSSFIDLKARTPAVKYFMNYDTPQDFLNRIYVAPPEEDREVEREMYLVMVKTPPRAKTHTLPNLIDEMDRFGIGTAVSLPVEIPFWPRHAQHTLDTCRGCDRVIPFAGVHPWDPLPLQRLEWFVGQGCRGMKFHPEFQFHPPDSRSALRLFGVCEDMDLPVLSHSGSTGREPGWMRSMSDVRRFRVIFKKFPKLRFVLGHCGIRFVDEAIACCNEFPNVYLETSNQPVPGLLKVFREADIDRVLFGTDWPFYPMAISMAVALIATDGKPELRKKFLFGNTARLLGLKEG